MKNVIVNEIVGPLRKFQNGLPRTSLMTIYKSFVKPHLGYGDITYDQGNNFAFHQKSELFSV